MPQGHPIEEFSSPASAVSVSPVSQALDMEEQALEDALVWARRRTAELLGALDDRELLALLDPPEPTATQERPALVAEPAESRPGEAEHAPLDSHERRLEQGEHVDTLIHLRPREPSSALPPPPDFSTEGPRPETVIGPAPTAPTAPPGALGSTPRSPRPQWATSGGTTVNEALRLVSARRYIEAIDRLEHVVRDQPQARWQVLLRVVQARQAIEERDLPRARACYEAALRVDPRNALAEQELSMLSAMGA